VKEIPTLTPNSVDFSTNFGNSGQILSRIMASNAANTCQ